MELRRVHPGDLQIEKLKLFQLEKKVKVRELPQSQAAGLPRHQEEDETDKTKQEQTQQTYEKR